MRQVKKARIVFFFLGLIIGCVILGAIGFSVISGKNKEIAQLTELKADATSLAFTRDLKADSTILPGDITTIETKAKNISNGGYFSSDGFSFSHYVLVRDADGNENQELIPMSMDDLVGKVVKADVYANQPVNDSVLYPDEDIPTESERFVEYNFLQVPSDVVENDYIDVRIQFPTGEDYIVLVGKKVVKIQESNTIFLKLNEDENFAMGSAIIETYMDDGVRLYARKYTDPATQLYDEKLVNLVADYETAYKKAKENLMEQNPNTSYISGDTETKAEVEPTIDDIIYNAKYLKYIKTSLISELKAAIADNDEQKLAFFGAYRLILDTKLARTYPLKKEVLNLVRTRPNVVQSIVDEFTRIAERNTRQDELERLRADLEIAPYASSLPYGSDTSAVKTKESITQEILQLEEKRKENIKDNLEAEQKTQRQERIAYLNTLLGSGLSQEQ